MQLDLLRVKGFRSIGPDAVSLTLNQELTTLIGPNGAGKTVFLHALARVFGDERALRTFVPADFHVPSGQLAPDETRELWIEATFALPELSDPAADQTAVATCFSVMRLNDATGVPCVRIRCTATLEPGGVPSVDLRYVLAVDEDGEPARTAPMRSHDRASIQVHYVPARRDPSEHVSYAAGSLLGRILRSVEWRDQQAEVSSLSEQIAESLGSHDAVARTTAVLSEHWSSLHKGAFHSRATLSFLNDEISSVLRHVTVAMSPGHGATTVDFSTMSDGQQSMFYLSLVLTTHALGREALRDEASSLFGRAKLRPPVLTILAIEEPENSLSPHHLGRILSAVGTMVAGHDAQAVIATHSPAVMTRVEPERVRYLRLDSRRTTTVSEVQLPVAADEAYKFVREALRAFPELYFARFVVLGEGDSEQIVLARCFSSFDAEGDATTVTIAPLGGRHVNHFWRLLKGLGIPHATLLDLDRGRHQAGWGRLKYAAEQLRHHDAASNISSGDIEELAAATDDVLSPEGKGPHWLSRLESLGIFFSTPLDLDFAMMTAFPDEYPDHLASSSPASDDLIKAVLGKGAPKDLYSEDELRKFESYHRLFQVGSKPVHHVAALARLSDRDLAAGMPRQLRELVKYVTDQLKEIPE